MYVPTSSPGSERNASTSTRSTSAASSLTMAATKGCSDRLRLRAMRVHAWRASCCTALAAAAAGAAVAAVEKQEEAGEAVSEAAWELFDARVSEGEAEADTASTSGPGARAGKAVSFSSQLRRGSESTSPSH